jgi:hypothetical protein
MGIECIEADPQAIVETAVVVPFIAAGHCAIHRKVTVELVNFGNRESRFDGLHRNFLDWFLPSVEAVMKSEAIPFELTTVGDPALRTVSHTT